jgi:hypothetical protein
MRATYWVWNDYGVDHDEFAFARRQTGITGEQIRQLWSGNPLPAPLPKPRLDEMTVGDLSDLLSSNIHWVVSDELLAVLEATDVKLQVIPVKVVGEKRKYQIANILERVPCLDETKSKIRRWKELDNAIRSIRKLVLKPIPADAPPVFHVAEFPLLVLVRDDLRQAMLAACKAPGRFVEAETATYG